MKRFGLTIALMGAIWSGMTQAQNRPVVLELFTSQGCSSCPPADKLLHELAKEIDVIALSLHVDYWDYIGWKDTFADPAFTERQRSYARAQRERMVYTPQIMVNGVEHVVGNRRDKVLSTLAKHRSAEPLVVIEASKTGRDVLIELDPSKVQARYIVDLVSYAPTRDVAISRGENAGRTISYTNVVTSWRSLERWNGRNKKTISVKVKNDDALVVIVQTENFGEIVGSIKVN